MQILITNDDGIDSPGLSAMARAARQRGHDVLVAAPDRPSSGASAAIGSRRHGRGPMIQEEHPDRIGMPSDVRCLAVETTPAQIVYLAAEGALGAPPPDMVLSGINCGANTGRAIVHSGTVGVAVTAGLLGLRSMAVSVDAITPRHWESAEKVTVKMMEWLEFQPFDGRVLNLNIPDVPLSDMRGMRAAPLAVFGSVQADDVDFPEDPVSSVRRVALAYEPEYARQEPGTDHYLLQRDWVTVTMLRWMDDDFRGLTLPRFDDLYLKPPHARASARPNWSE